MPPLCRFAAVAWVLGAWMYSATAQAPLPVTDEVEVAGHYLNYVFLPGGGRIDECVVRSTGRDVAGPDGLLLEGFGVGSPYIPSRRLNERVEILPQAGDRPVIRYTYDCDGPNIRGLRVTRTMEPLPDESSLRVRWRLENTGAQDLWVAPWVCSRVMPGGVVDDGDRIDVPSLSGVHGLERSGWHPAARNWMAATDPAARETVYTVFNADHIHSFLGLFDEEEGHGLQAALVPRIYRPGDVWETEYRINVIRGLSRVDFASAELAAQIDYKPGRLEVRIAPTHPLPSIEMSAVVVGAGDQTWTLPRQRFAAAPDKVIVCSYEWTAPGDGAYEFMARLKAGGRDFPLNAGLAAPHGGIDTQFVVGEPARTTFEAWTDAPYGIDRGPRVLDRPVAARGDFTAWFATGLEKIYRQDSVNPEGEIRTAVRVRLARNERESFQLALRPPTGRRLSDVTFHLEDLVHESGRARIPAENISIHNVLYYPVRVPTHFEGPTGDCPDALPPYKPFSAPGGQTTPVWFTLYAPPGIPAGLYKGKLEMEAIETRPFEFWIEAEVYDFDLPATPALKTDFGFWPEGAYQWARQLGYTGSSESVSAAYLQNALEHRVTLREGCQLPAESPDYAASLRRFEARLDDLQARGVTTFAVPASLLDTPEQLEQANAFVVRHKLKDRAFCHIADDPAPPAWPRLSERMQLWNRIAPDIPLMVTTAGLEPYLPEMGRIWGVHLQMFDTLNNEPILKRLEEGHQVWLFVDAFPAKPYGNFFIDFQAVEHRLLFWQAWALDVQGFHYWSINYTEPGQNPYFDQLDITPTHGDGFLVYPGTAGPVDSIRWENIRDGIEDYDYLALLRAHAIRVAARSPRSRALEIARRALDLEALVPDLVRFSRDPDAVQAKRDEIARAIVALSRE